MRAASGLGLPVASAISAYEQPISMRAITASRVSASSRSSARSYLASASLPIAVSSCYLLSDAMVESSGPSAGVRRLRRISSRMRFMTAPRR